MAKQTVNIGVTANDNTGDPLRTAFDKLNDNFDEVYAAGPAGTNIQISDNTIASTNTNGNIDLDPAGTGKVLINGPMDANGVVTLNSTVTGNVVPTAANTYNLGSSSAPYKELYVSGSSLHIGNLVLKEVDTMLEVFQSDGVTNAILSGNSTTSGTVLNNGNTVVSLTQNGPITFYANNYQDGNATVTVVNSSNITTPALISTGAVTGTSLTDGTATISSGALTGVTTITASGNISGGNLSGTNVSGTLETAAQPNITSVGTLTSVTATGNVTGGNLTTAGDVTTATVTASGNVSGGNLVSAADVTTVSVTASGDITANNATVTNDTQTATVTFSGDSSEQTTAYKPHFYFLDSDGSPVTSTLTDHFGVSASLKANHYYQIMVHLLVDNSSTGNIQVGISDTAGDISNLTAQMTVGRHGGGVESTHEFSASNQDYPTLANGTGIYHVQIAGSIKTTSATDVSFEIATSTGNITAKAGSNFNFTEFNANSVGDVS